MSVEITRVEVGGKVGFLVTSKDRNDNIYYNQRTLRGVISAICKEYDLNFCDVVDLLINLGVGHKVTV